MKVGKTARVVLDAALSLMIVFEMLIQFTGEFLHEVIGFAFFATVAVHVALSAAWVRKTARNAREGKLTARRTALAVVGCLLAATTVVLGVSSVAISGILFSAGFVWPIGSYSLWASVHTVSAYALCAIVVVHLAMHWAFLASAMKVSYDPSRRRAISTGVNAVAALGVLALGVTAAGKTLPQVASAAQGALGIGGAAGAGNVGSGGSAAGASGVGSASGVSSSGSAGDVNAASGENGASGAAGANSSRGANSTGPATGTSDGASAEASTSGNLGKVRGRGSGKPGKTHGKGGGTSSGESGLGPVSGSASDSSDSQFPSGDAAYGAGAGAGAGGSSSTQGICTLCRKQCSLSAPKCDKPYEAGLL